MSKRNFILLILVLTIVTAVIFGFLYSRRGVAPPGDDAGPDTSFFSQFNPFGGGSGPGPSSGGTEPVDVSGFVPGPDDTPGKMRKISSMPVAGYGVFQKERFKDLPPPDPTPEPAEGEDATPPSLPPPEEEKPNPPSTEFVPAVRYVDRATGNIYQTFLDQIQERKFSDTLIPKVHEANFGNRGRSVVMRYLDSNNNTIETFLGTLPEELLGGDTSSENEVVGTFLPENTRDISVSSDGVKMFYLFDSGDGIVGTTLDFLTDKKVQIFDSPFTEWLSAWPNSKILTLTTKPSWNVPGYMYSIDPAKKDLVKVLGDINGLTTLTSPSGELTLYANNNLSLYVYRSDTRDTSLLALRTLPEKCVWGSASAVIYCAVPRALGAGQYPDPWYQGEVSFEDQFWKIDVESGNVTLLVDPATETEEAVDGIKLGLSDDERYLLFVNKKDSFLWEIELE
jgi:hypothetical protein